MIKDRDVLTSDGIAEMQDALAKLGYNRSIAKAASFMKVGYRRWKIVLGGISRGIYDLDRHTFVD